MLDFRSEEAIKVQLSTKTVARLKRYNVVRSLLSSFSRLNDALFTKPLLLNEFYQHLDKLEKLARKGPKAEESSSTSDGGAASPSDAGVSTDKRHNYVVNGGVVVVSGVAAWKPVTVACLAPA